MNVGQALNVLRSDVASALELLVELHGFVCAQLRDREKWYDLASFRHRAIALSPAVPAKYNEALELFSEIINLFKNMKVICNGKPAWKPSQTVFSLASKSIIGLSKALLDSGKLDFLITA